MSKLAKTGLGNREIFARNLKRYVDQSGKQQKEIAKEISISAGTFNDWMRARVYPRMDKIQLLAEYFGISKSDLIDEWDSSAEEALKRDQEVLELFHKVPEEKREFVLSLIQSLIDNL
jgi:transcriptional regulator with XRE-family HTH domain